MSDYTHCTRCGKRRSSSKRIGMCQPCSASVNAKRVSRKRSATMVEHSHDRAFWVGFSNIERMQPSLPVVKWLSRPMPKGWE
jgi:hypothetical protein